MLSLFSLIYSECEDGTVNVSGDDTEKCGTEIDDCLTYDVSSSSTTPKCAVCDGKIPSSNKETCEECASGKETKDGKNCYTKIDDCEEYAEDGKCAACDVTSNKVPVAETGATCVECASGKETKDGKNCYTKITDCEEYAEDGKCAACDGKIPSSDKTACEACAEGKETKDGKNCYTIIANCEEYEAEGKCKKCIDGKETKDGKKCYTKITDCEEYEAEGKCATCNVANNKVPVADTGATCEACASGKETKDGKNCYTPITDCSEYEAEGKCSVCGNNKVPKSDKSACEACPDGKKTTDGKTCVENNNSSDSSTSFIKMSIMGLLVLFSVL